MAGKHGISAELRPELCRYPSEVAKLSWSDLLVCVQCVRARGDRIKRILKKGKRKKDMIFPNISIIDLADIL